MPSELKRTRVVLNADAFAGAVNANRTPGIHATDVLRDIDELLGKQQKSDFTEEDLSQFALQGYQHEDVVEQLMTAAFRDRVRMTDGRCIADVLPGYERTPEIAVKLDGSGAFALNPLLPKEMNAEMARGCLILSPDGMSVTPGSARLAELKWTIASARMKPEQKKPHWFPQVKLYLLAVSVYYRKRIDDVVWIVQFPVGERWGDVPIFEVWEQSFAPHETFAQFRTVQQHVAWRH
jgi:hypothetical protein